MWNSCCGMTTNEVCIVLTLVAGQRIYCEDDSKVKDRNDPVQYFLIPSEVQPDNCSRSSLIVSERIDNRRARWIRARDTRKWRLRPVRINWKWAARADTTVLVSSTTWQTHASPPCTPRCLLQSSSREPTLRLLCTSRIPVSFLRLFYISPFVCDWCFGNTMAIADVRFPRFSSRFQQLNFSSEMDLFRDWLEIDRDKM